MAIAEGLALRPIPAAQPDTLVRIYPVSDAITYAIASLVVLASSLAACYLPARRAGRLEPMTVLRIE
jgi:ABC-type lipoprotein release transport system permease subunit